MLAIAIFILLLVSLLFIAVINPYSLFKFKIFALNTSLLLHFVVGMIMYGYNTVEHCVTGANNCTGANYC